MVKCAYKKLIIDINTKFIIASSYLAKRISCLGSNGDQIFPLLKVDSLLYDIYIISSY